MTKRNTESSLVEDFEQYSDWVDCGSGAGSYRVSESAATILETLEASPYADLPMLRTRPKRRPKNNP
jgi:hypothetical protein